MTGFFPLCVGASTESVDLLPSPSTGADWTRDLRTDEGHESDQIYEFDGASNAAVVPESALNHNLSTRFTLSFWMKHEAPLDPANKHMKEHIICNADDHSKCRSDLLEQWRGFILEDNGHAIYFTNCTQLKNKIFIAF